MTGNLIIISIIGLVIGFVLSIPVAGPTSIVITSNALKGRTRYANLINVGASLADIVYVFFSVFGLTKLYSVYKPYIPYLLFAGAIFVVVIGYKIFKTKLVIDRIGSNGVAADDKIQKSENGFITGVMLGFLNPSLFFGWMSSSFIVFTVLAFLGFNTGGLDQKVSNQLTEITIQKGKVTKDSSTFPLNKWLKSGPSYQNILKHETEEVMPENYPLMLSMFYAISVAIGSVSWFVLMIWILAKFRMRINVNILYSIIKVLGLVLMLFGVLLAYKGIRMII